MGEGAFLFVLEDDARGAQRPHPRPRHRHGVGGIARPVQRVADRPRGTLMRVMRDASRGPGSRRCDRRRLCRRQRQSGARPPRRRRCVRVRRSRRAGGGDQRRRSASPARRLRRSRPRCCSRSAASRRPRSVWPSASPTRRPGPARGPARWRSAGARADVGSGASLSSPWPSKLPEVFSQPCRTTPTQLRRVRSLAWPGSPSSGGSAIGRGIVPLARQGAACSQRAAPARSRRPRSRRGRPGRPWPATWPTRRRSRRWRPQPPRGLGPVDIPGQQRRGHRRRFL